MLCHCMSKGAWIGGIIKYSSDKEMGGSGSGET
jgi:hypothetical protein